MKRDLSTPLSSTFGDPKKKKKDSSKLEALKNQKKMLEKRGNSTLKSLNITGRHHAGARKNHLKELARVKKAIKTLSDKETTLSDKETSTMHKTRNPKPGPYAY